MPKIDGILIVKPRAALDVVLDKSDVHCHCSKMCLKLQSYIFVYNLFIDRWLCMMYLFGKATSLFQGVKQVVLLSQSATFGC